MTACTPFLHALHVVMQVLLCSVYVCLFVRLKKLLVQCFECMKLIPGSALSSYSALSLYSSYSALSSCSSYSAFPRTYSALSSRTYGALSSRTYSALSSYVQCSFLSYVQCSFLSYVQCSFLSYLQCSFLSYVQCSFLSYVQCFFLSYLQCSFLVRTVLFPLVRTVLFPLVRAVLYPLVRTVLFPLVLSHTNIQTTRRLGVAHTHTDTATRQVSLCPVTRIHTHIYAFSSTGVARHQRNHPCLACGPPANDPVLYSVWRASRMYTSCGKPAAGSLSSWCLYRQF